jgi:ABC-type lipoprotein export system ATPase subunit
MMKSAELGPDERRIEMDTYISKFELRNYRSCNKTAVDLNNNLSALIGVNGSGKSNFLNGLLLLKKMARIPRHTPDEEFAQSVCRIKATFNVEQKPLPFEAVIKYTINELNVDQVINATQTWNFKEFTGENNLVKLPMSRFIEFREFRKYPFMGQKPKGLREKEWEFYISRSYQALSGSSVPFDPAQLDIIIATFEKIYDFITGISYYSASQFTDPTKCPTYFEIENEKILRRPGRDWNEHQRFMFDLYGAYKNPKSKFKEFLSIVGKEGIGLIDNIKYDEIEVPTNIYEVGIGGKLISKEIKRLLVIPNFIIRSFKLSPNQLSEGTFKTLAIVFYLVTDTSRLLILEEPEVCIHHGLLASILELIKEFAREKQIIISTHSDFVLDGLDPENVFVVRNDPQKGTTIKHIPDALSARDYRALKEYLKESGNLGEYWRHGELEK